MKDEYLAYSCDLKAKEVGSQLAGFAGQAFGDFALMNMAIGGVYLIGGFARAMMPSGLYGFFVLLKEFPAFPPQLLNLRHRHPQDQYQ